MFVAVFSLYSASPAPSCSRGPDGVDGFGGVAVVLFQLVLVAEPRAPFAEDPVSPAAPPPSCRSRSLWPCRRGRRSSGWVLDATLIGSRNRREGVGIRSGVAPVEHGRCCPHRPRWCRRRHRRPTTFVARVFVMVSLPPRGAEVLQTAVEVGWVAVAQHPVDEAVVAEHDVRGVGGVAAGADRVAPGAAEQHVAAAAAAHVVAADGRLGSRPGLDALAPHAVGEGRRRRRGRRPPLLPVALPTCSAASTTPPSPVTGTVWCQPQTWPLSQKTMSPPEPPCWLLGRLTSGPTCARRPRRRRLSEPCP